MHRPKKRKCYVNLDSLFVNMPENIIDINDSITSTDGDAAERQISHEVEELKKQLREKLDEMKKVNEDKRKKVLESNEIECKVSQVEKGVTAGNDINVPIDATISTEITPAIPIVDCLNANDNTRLNPASPTSDVGVECNGDEDDDDVFLDAPSSLANANATNDASNNLGKDSPVPNDLHQSLSSSQPTRKSSRNKSVTVKMKEFC